MLSLVSSCTYLRIVCSPNELNYTRAKFRLDCIENTGNYKQRHSPDGLLVAFYSAEVMMPKAKTQLARKNNFRTKSIICRWKMRLSTITQHPWELFYFCRFWTTPAPLKENPHIKPQGSVRNASTSVFWPATCKVEYCDKALKVVMLWR